MSITLNRPGRRARTPRAALGRDLFPLVSAPQYRPPLGLAGVFAIGSDNPPDTATAVTVDFRQSTWPVDKWSIGSCISTYGGNSNANINANPAWRDALAALGPLTWRVPLRYSSGNPGSSAGGAQTSGDAVTYLSNIRAMGGNPYPAIGGNTTDNGFTSGEAGGLVAYLNANNGAAHGGRIERFIIGNEPENAGGAAVDTYIAALPAWIAAMKAADPNILVSAPAAAYWDPATIARAAAIAGVDVLSYHAYDGANNDATGWPATAHYRQHILDLRAAYPGRRYALEEFNFHSFYGPDPAFFDWRNTGFVASVIGQTLSAGGNACHYSDSNGPLGLMNDGQGQDQPGALLTKLPAYWGLGMWTGMAGLFRRVGASMVQAAWTAQPTVNNVAMLECYPSTSGKVLMINKHTSDYTIDVGFGGLSSGRYVTWATNPGAPTTGPTQTGSGAITGGRLTLTVPARTVMSVDITNA